MGKTITILLAAMLMVFLCVSCNNGGIVDDAFNCVVTFDGNGADSGEMPCQTVSRGGGTRLNANAFEKTDYRFAGWNTEADGSGTAYADGQSIGITESATLYAQWSLYKATISFNSNSGSGMMENQKVVVDVNTALNANTFEKADYRFIGWNTAADGSGIAFADRQDIRLVGSITLYAQWKSNWVTISFDSNKGIGEMDNQVVWYETATPLDPNSFTVFVDNAFTGWNTKADGSGTAYANMQEISVEDDIVLYAQWSMPVDNPSNNTTTWNNGTNYILNEDVTIGGRITVSGSVTLILPDGFTLTASRGIAVNEGNSLTINAPGNGTGTLISSGNIASGYAAIGGDVYKNAGTITINGGNVTATGGYNGAGIGGGASGAGGTTTINGGTIMATGVYYGAGIGGGSGGSGGTITINGGTVTAISNRTSGTAAGIGGGGNNGIGGTITINGGTVVAEGGPYSSEGNGTVGIGGGFFNYNTGTITLGSGVELQVSSDNSDWSDYIGTRKRFMRTK